MRALIGAVVALALVASLGAAAQKGPEQTWKGAISDSNCNAKHPAGEHEGKKMTAADCTGVCVKKGAKYVFVSDGKVFQLANQSSKQIASHAGQQIELTGTIEGNTITARSMKAAATK
jgi:Tfp pilus assembly protein PilW